MSLQLPEHWTQERNKKLRAEFAIKLAQRLKSLREEQKMTQQEVAEKAGLHLTYLGHLELGRYHPSTYVIWKIAMAMNIETDRILSI